MTNKKTLAKLCSATLIIALLITACSPKIDKEAIKEEARVTTTEVMDSLKTIDEEKFTSLTTAEFQQNEDFSKFFDKTQYYEMILSDSAYYDKLNAMTQKTLDEKLIVIMSMMIGDYEIKDIQLDAQGKTAIVELSLNMKKVSNSTILSTKIDAYFTEYIYSHYSELQSDYNVYGEEYVKVKIMNKCLPDLMDMVIEEIDTGLFTTTESHTIKLKLEKGDTGFKVTEGSFT